MSGGFIPESFARTFLEQMLEGHRAMSRRLAILNGIDPDNPPTVYVEQPRDQTWLDDRDDFARRWKYVIDQGLENGWLERVSCFECGGELKVTEETTDWVEQSNPDYDPTKPNPYRRLDGDSITIPVRGKATGLSHAADLLGGLMYREHKEPENRGLSH